jgi:uncharacterized membrane protein
LPAGASGVFTPSSVTGAGTANLAVSTSVTLAAGVYNLTITGTSGVLTHSVGVQLIVNPATPADFTISASDITVKRHKTGSEPVTITPTNGFTGTVDLGLTGVPSGVQITLSPTTITGGSGTSTLTITVANSAAQGSFPITITGTSGSLIHPVVITLSVN